MVELGNIDMADCVDMSVQIGTVDFKHCPRDANSVAHELASFSFHNNISCVWGDEPPSCLIVFLANDVSVS